MNYLYVWKIAAIIIFVLYNFLVFYYTEKILIKSKSRKIIYILISCLNMLIVIVWHNCNLIEYAFTYHLVILVILGMEI